VSNGPTPMAAIRLRLGSAIADAAVFDGWSAAAVAAAAAAEGVAPEIAELAFAADTHNAATMLMIDAWIDHIDAAMAAALPADLLATLPIRERIRRLVRFRLEAIAGQEEALRRALSIMAMPLNAGAALKRGWHSADLMWRLAGDTATDYNHYTKRVTLAALYAATLPVFADDASEGKAETWAFLDRRIAGVMRFEKAKAQLLGGGAKSATIRPWFSPVRALGWLRYPAV